VDTPFGATWNRLTLRDVERFLARKPGESQTWDAKGNPAEHDRQGTTREQALKKIIWKASSAFANERGGFLVLGAASKTDGTYTIEGVDLPRKVKEPHDWVASVVRRLDPPPSFDVKEFPIGDRWLLIARIDEATVRPCVAPDGRAYRRLGSQSAPADHEALARWGRTADQLRRKAERIVTARLKEMAEQQWRSPAGGFIAGATFAVAAAVPGLELAAETTLDDIRSGLVDIEAQLPVRSTETRRPISRVGQHAALAGSEIGLDEAWTVQFESNGVAVVTYFHARLRPAQLPEEITKWNWPKRTRQQFVAAAVRAAEAAIVVGTGVAASDLRRDLVAGLSIPARGHIRHRRDKPDAWPVVVATRWKAVGSASKFVADVLDELSRVDHRPFEGYPPLKVVPFRFSTLITTRQREK
jgi:hypothetical protein